MDQCAGEGSRNRQYISIYTLQEALLAEWCIISA